MILAEKYKTGTAFWRAIQERSKTLAKAEGRSNEAIQKQFVRERLLARVFQGDMVHWVLKGGNAVLARVSDARATQDVDLLNRLGDLDDAYNELVGLARIDVSDHFRFEPVRRIPAGQGTDQPAVEGERVLFDAYCGSKKVHQIKVDLVVGSVMTAVPDELSNPVLQIEGLEPVRLRLYPVVDHAADKLCATQARYGSLGGRSTRVRDLVDLVIFARTQDIDGTALTNAIASEWSLRQLEGKPSFDPPQEWAVPYAAEARKVGACGTFTDFESAKELAILLLAPACAGEAEDRRWDHAILNWIEPKSS